MVCGLPPSFSLPHCWWGLPTPLCSFSGRPRAGPSAHYPYPSPWVAPSSQILGTQGYVEPLSSTPLRGHFLLYFTQTFIVFKLYPALKGRLVVLFVMSIYSPLSYNQEVFSPSRYLYSPPSLLTLSKLSRDPLLDALPLPCF